MPMKPSLPISSISSRGTFLCSSISAAFGRTFSRAKSRAVRWTSCCSSLSERSKPDDSVVVVVAMVVLQRVDADVPAVRILREEEVAMEFADRAAGALCLVVRRAHIGHAEPDDKAGLHANLGRRFGIAFVVHDDLRVRGVHPGRVRAIVSGQAEH